MMRKTQTSNIKGQYKDGLYSSSSDQQIRLVERSQLFFKGRLTVKPLPNPLSDFFFLINRAIGGTTDTTYRVKYKF